MSTGALSRRDQRRRIALVLVSTLTVMATMAIAPSLPSMARAFAGTPNAELLVKLTLTVPAIAIALFAPLAGWFIDRFGRLKLLYASMVLFGLAGMSGFWIDDLYLILVSRFVLGIAIAGSMTTMHTLAGDYFTGEVRARFAGFQSVIMSFGAMVLVGLGGLFADVDWRAPFLLYVYGWILIPIVAPYLEEPTRSAREAAAAGREPLDLRALLTVYALAWFSAVMFYMVASQLPFLLAERGIGSGLLLGLAVGLVQALAAVGSHFHHRIKSRRTFYTVYAIAFSLMAMGYVLIGAVESYVVVCLGSAIAGIGVGLFFPNSTLWVLTLAPPRMRGRCSGGLSAALNFGQFTSPVVVQPAVIAFGLSGAFGASAAALAVVAALLVAGQKRAPRSG